MEESSEFPVEIEEKMRMFHETVENLEKSLKPLLENNIENVKINPLDKARLYLTAAYTMNSLFWMHLVTKGENPKEHPLKGEIDRVKMYMMRMKEIEDKNKAPKLDKSAAKLFLRNALWESSTEKAENQPPRESDSHSSPKRKIDVLEEKSKRKCVE